MSKTHRLGEDRLYNLLIRGREVTKAYLKKGHKMSIEGQIARIHEEVSETYRAFRNGDRENLLEEASDIVFATITLLDLLEIPHDEFTQAMEQKLELLEKRSGVKDW